MNKKVKLIVITLCILVSTYFTIIFLTNLIVQNICENSIIESVESLNDEKKIVIFSTNCGATSGYGMHVSVLNINQYIDNNSTGNILRLSSNNGEIWPKDALGRPIVRAKWENENLIILEYSSNSDVFFQVSEINGIKVDSFAVVE